MDRLNLPRALRSILQEVGNSGGDRDLYIELDRKLLRDIRGQFYDAMSKAQVAPGHWKRSSSLDEFLERDRLELRIRFCIVRLREAGVPDSQHAVLLERAVSLVVKSLLDSGRVSGYWAYDNDDVSSIDEVIIRKLSQCFSPGYYPGHVLHYGLLEEHEFIFWKNSVEAWKLSSLGEYARRLNTFSLLLFLLGIEFNFTRGDRRGRYPTKELAAELVEGRPQPTSMRRGATLPRALSWYGILEDEPWDSKPLLSEFGRQLLGAALRRSEDIRNLVLLLTEIEHYGFNLPNSTSVSLFEEELSSDLLTESEKTSLGTVERLVRSGDALDALRLIFPLIEAILNSALDGLGISGAGQVGMRSKIDQLVRHGLLSSRLGNLTEIVVARNKSVHGNLDDQDDLLDPLYVFVASVFKAMLSELRGRKVGGNA